MARREEYLRMLHGISSELSERNVNSIVFLTDLASQLPARDKPAGLEVLQVLWRRGYFSETKLDPLERLLKDVMRNDLLGKYLEEFKLKYPCRGGIAIIKQQSDPSFPAPFNDFDDRVGQQIISRSSSSFFPEGIAHRSPPFGKRAKSSSVSIMTSDTGVTQSDTDGESCSQDENDEVRLSRAEFDELLIHSNVKETSLSRKLQEKIKFYRCAPTFQITPQSSLCKCRRSSSSISDNSSVGSFCVGDKRNSTSSEGYSSGPHDTSHDPICTASDPVVASHKQTMKSHDSEDNPSAASGSVQPTGQQPTHSGWTVSWKLKREDLLWPIFNHKTNKFFEKKIHITAGTDSSKNNIDIRLKFYPYGIDRDQNTSCSIKVEIVSTSKQPSSSAYLVLNINGLDTKANNMIVSRQAESPLLQKTFVIMEFLSHEIVKCSVGKYFDFRVTVRVKYHVSNDWVFVNTGQTAYR